MLLLIAWAFGKKTIFLFVYPISSRLLVGRVKCILQNLKRICLDINLIMLWLTSVQVLRYLLLFSCQFHLAKLTKFWNNSRKTLRQNDIVIYPFLAIVIRRCVYCHCYLSDAKEGKKWDRHFFILECNIPAANFQAVATIFQFIFNFDLLTAEGLIDEHLVNAICHCITKTLRHTICKEGKN